MSIILHKETKRWRFIDHHGEIRLLHLQDRILQESKNKQQNSKNIEKYTLIEL